MLCIAVYVTAPVADVIVHGRGRGIRLRSARFATGIVPRAGSMRRSGAHYLARRAAWRQPPVDDRLGCLQQLAGGMGPEVPRRMQVAFRATAGRIISSHRFLGFRRDLAVACHRPRAMSLLDAAPQLVSKAAPARLVGITLIEGAGSQSERRQGCFVPVIGARRPAPVSAGRQHRRLETGGTGPSWSRGQLPSKGDSSPAGHVVTDYGDRQTVCSSGRATSRPG